MPGQQLAITGDVATRKFRFDLTAFYRWKDKATSGTLCRGQDLVSIRLE